MKVETPQLRWHQIINPQSQKDAGANGPILSCSLLSINDKTGVLATAGNTEVNLWRVRFTEDAARLSTAAADAGNEDGNAKNNDGQRSSSSHILVQPKTNANAPQQQQLNEHTQIEHIVTLSRGTNERGINAVKFSPSGLHLVAAGDGGTVVVWSVPITHTTDSGSVGISSSSFWSSIEKETDAPMKILFNQSDDVMDLAWSADSKRFTVCSLDHTLTVWEHPVTGNPTGGGQGEWRNVYRSDNHHTHYIQGVAYDPKGVYLASMGSDRMVKVYSRKNVKDTVVKGELAKYAVETSATTEAGNGSDGDQQGKEQQEELDKKDILQSKVLPELLTNSTFALQQKIKTMKFLDPKPTATSSTDDAKDNDKDPSKEAAPNNTATKRHHMFADELTLGGFFRRLAFTTDGAFLVVPAALWHGKSDTSATTKDTPTSPNSVVSSEEKLAESSFATYLFARHHFDQPYKVLTGLEKPSVVVRPNPVLFQLPPNTKSNSNSNSTPLLPYRSIFAVLTADTVLLYDTHHNHPLAMARGLHYAGLTDAAWSTDGRTLFVTSSDGYVSILSFGDGELGEVYVAPTVKVVEKVGASDASDVGEKVGSDVPSSSSKQPESNTGVTINTLVPKKKKKIAPTAIDAADSEGSDKKKVTFATPADDRSNPSVSSQPIINTLVPKKKKKKIAPTLVTPTVQQEQNDGEEGTATSTMEKKRSAEEATTAPPSTELLQEASINILVPKKKKKKVASSSTPVATM
mmetsp:Transcript_31338/g.56774  ORF Transcript_31338/g.56774 Transcript_31338/m.56774 type:complete len:746 (+) Transcript_31338:168-2405(+)